MNDISFTYNGKSLSEFNCMLCNFDSKNNIEVLETPTITFNTIQNNQNDTFNSTYTSYDNALESSEVGICKMKCNDRDIYFTQDEVREIYQWLDLRSYKELTIDNSEEFENVHFICGFTTIQLVKNKNKTIGFKVKFVCKHPYGLSDDLSYSKYITNEDNVLTIVNDSDDIKPVYPTLFKVKINEDGDLLIKNEMDRSNDILIKNCKVNEIIEIDCLNRIIETNLMSHDIYNDFNYNYFRLIKNDKTSTNKFSISLNCKIEVIFNVPRKVGFI